MSPASRHESWRASVYNLKTTDKEQSLSSHKLLRDGPCAPRRDLGYQPSATVPHKPSGNIRSYLTEIVYSRYSGWLCCVSSLSSSRPSNYVARDSPVVVQISRRNKVKSLPATGKMARTSYSSTASPPPGYRPTCTPNSFPQPALDERTPLNPGNNTRRAAGSRNNRMYWQTINTTELIVIPTKPTATRTLGRSLLYAVLLLIVTASIVENIWIVVNYPDYLKPATRAAIREKWEKERLSHQLEHEIWERDLQRERELEQQRENRQHEWERLERAWEKEREEHRRELERWERERKDLERQREEELEQWERERKDLERQREEERQQWEREKREDERRRREEERRRLGLYWDEPQAKNCVSYGTREHTARLRNISSGYNWVQACEEMSIEIHNRTIDTPSRCEDAGASGIFGHWQVDFEEPACVPYWGGLYDKGCVGYGTRLHRFEARLWNLQKDDDWTNMCGTTPAVIHGVHHAKPTYCEYRGAFYGMVGMWDQLDNRCR
ncbi:hypothetical protein SCP_0211530 [Sparassis crispa]|uniref:Uncharacterized protein n=1 Tax=Sparassis crispa TaxID=139825 RepID=A0A401GCT3_9APHY|nr:hypothetical protein SCP_0211530 [Sparassis crispa]GBE79951.1 hypothetical protein SCP_0211530 [Sparassis crispa]